MQAIKKFFLVAGSIAGVALFMSVAVTVVLLALDDDGRVPLWEMDAPPPAGENGPELNGEAPEDITRPDDDEGSFLRPPARTNFLFIGLDNQQLADAIMVGTFYRESGDIKLMSIPRDMYTVIPDRRLEQMRADGLRTPSPLKINELRAFGGSIHGTYYLQAQLGEMLGVQFHYYVEVELAAFRRIVEAIDGVEMYIPRRMFYEDPYQNPPLLIDIPAGMQRLDGDMAEGLVRFRSFRTGDLERNNMQMEFMSQLIRQALTREAIMNDPLALIGVLINYVRTNAGLLDAARYLPFIGNIGPGSISTFSLPGEGTYVGGVSWFIPDTQRLPAVVSQVFFANPEPVETAAAQ